MLQSMESQRVGHNRATELNCTDLPNFRVNTESEGLLVMSDSL